MNVADIIDACDRKFRAQGLERLTPKERLVVLASWANFEVEQGGMGAFFHNLSGTYARETVAALIELGAMDEAAAINKGRELLRHRSWKQLAASREFERLTDKFLAAMPGLFERLGTFIEAHADELGKSARGRLAGRARKARA